MSAKQENTFIAAVHKFLPKHVYREKMNNPYRSGTPDVYYENTLTLWVEYKFIELPKREDTLIIPGLSPLQKDWLQRNYDNGHEPWVIVGCAAGGTVFRTPGAWTLGVTAGNFVASMQTRKQLAELIAARTL